MTHPDDRHSRGCLCCDHDIPFPRDLRDTVLCCFLTCSDVLSLREAGRCHGGSISHSADIHRFLGFWDNQNSGFSQGLDCHQCCSPDMYKFRWPYNEAEGELRVKSSNTVAYMNFVIHTSSLLGNNGLVGRDPNRNGVYLEILTHHLDDLISLSLVDFDGGGRASVTFNADMGTVVVEEKLSGTAEQIKIVKGRFCYPLPPAGSSSNTSTPAHIGVFLSLDGDITFLRRKAGWDTWESTGVISNCREWVKEKKLVTPCVAFAGPGAYKIQIVHVGSVLPYHAECACRMTQKDLLWTSNTWAGFSSSSSQTDDSDDTDQSGTDPNFDGQDSGSDSDWDSEPESDF